MALSRTKKWSTELKAGFCQRILNKEINKEWTDKAYIEMIWKHFYPDCPYKMFRKNWHSSVAEYCVGKSYDAMTMIYSYSYQDTHQSRAQVKERTLKEESYHSSQDSNFKHKESVGLSIDLSDFVEEDEEELQALKDNTKQEMSSKKAAPCVRTISCGHKSLSCYGQQSS